MKRIVTLLFVISLLFGSVNGQILAQEEMDLGDDFFEVQDENDITSTQDGINIDPQAVEYRFRRSWGGEGDQLINPQGLAVDENKNLYVANTGLERITIINPYDRTVRSIGGPGTEPGKFYALNDLALASDGTIFTVETTNSRVQHFHQDGTLINYWGSYDDEDYQFSFPENVAVSKDNRIYVSNKGNHLVKVYTYDGQYVTSLGGEGDGPGQFYMPGGIAFDEAGNVYVADTGNHRIQKFDHDGNYTLEWSDLGNDGGTLRWPSQIAVGMDGNIIVGDFGIRLSFFSPTGTFLGFIREVAGWWPGQAETGGLAVDSEGAIYESLRNLHEVNKYSADWTYLRDWGNRDTTVGKFVYPWSVVFNSMGDLLVLEEGNHRVQQFSPSGSLKMKFDTIRGQDGEFYTSRGIALDKTDNIYVVDPGNKKIQVLNKNGEFIRAFGIYGEESMWLIAVDSKGNIYLASSNLIQKYNNEGGFIISWEIESGSSIYIDKDDYLYVSSEVIEQYDLDGNHIRSIGQAGYGVDQIHYPQGIFITSNGNFYIADYSNDRIVILDANGNYLNSIGSFGNLPGQLYKPGDVLVAENGDVYVADRYNHRIQVFSPQVIQPDSYRGLVQNGGFEKNPALMEWTTGGDLPVARTSNRYQGNYGMRLGQQVAQKEQAQREAWAYTNFYVDPNWSRPVLKFKYRMHVNDIIDYSDFFVAVQDGVGLNHLETVLRDGYKPCNPGEPPSAGQDLGWRTASFDLSKYKGQHIRINFSNRNLWPMISLGIWTDIDDVMVRDEGPLPYAGPYRMDLPLIYNRSCDLRGKGITAEESIMMRPLTPDGE